MHKTIIASASLALTTALAGCGTITIGHKDPEPIRAHLTLKGNVGDDGEIDDESRTITSTYGGDVKAKLGDECKGNGGFSDIETGAQATLETDGGKTVATAKLFFGKLENDGNSANECLFVFQFEDVKLGDGYYEIKVAGRGGPKYTAKQLQDGPDLTLE